MKGKSEQNLAPISADAIYPLPDFMRRTGLAKAAIRAMRRAGFIVRKIGRRSYVWGRDFQDWVEKQAEIVGSTCPS